jgi:hypothetical protein
MHRVLAMISPIKNQRSAFAGTEQSDADFAGRDCLHPNHASTAWCVRL